MAGLGSGPDGAALRRCPALQKAVWLDAGKRDEWFLDLGMQAFARVLDSPGVTDVHQELFDAKHGGIDYRYPLSLAYLAARLAPS